MSVKLQVLCYLVLGVAIICDVLEKGMAMPVQSRDKRSDDTEPLEAVVEKLAQQVSSQNSRIAVLENKANVLGKAVAFNAWNNAHPMHASAQGTLVFDHAVTNIGNAYSPLTGVFTAPVSGLYHFQTTFMSSDLGNGHYVHANIYVGSDLVAIGISDSQHGHYDQTTISSVVHVSAGQQVYVKNGDGRTSNYYGSSADPYTTFSGFLLHAD